VFDLVAANDDATGIVFPHWVYLPFGVWFEEGVQRTRATASRRFV
jgi:hypothetical protein